MATGKVVVITRGGMDKDSKDVFIAAVPRGWQPVFLDMNDGDAIVAKELENAEYIVCSGTPLPQKLVENAKKLKLFQAGGQDTGHLPRRFAMEKGIPVANAGGANAIAVSEYTVSAILNLMKRVLQYNQGIRDGKWRVSMDRKGQHELFGKTVGIVGFGNIGRRVATLCYAFGASIIYTERFFVPYALRADTRAKPVSLEELLRESDVVSLHVPAFSANKAMIGGEQLNMMKPTAYLINTSRGANIDEKALIKALNEGKIAGAAIDVWDPEPPSPDNPLIKMPNVVATPHMAGSSWENTALGFEAVWTNIVLVSEGKEPLNRIRDI
jgi:phosphoglycerate dehydrogenase-like enzyme